MNIFIEKAVTKKSLSMRKPLCGVGINDADYMVTDRSSGKIISCPYYRAWSGMIKRCYSKETQKRQPTYVGCSVCGEWLTFSNFKIWMKDQEWEGKQLDKDLIKPGNKVYSPENCMFVSKSFNTLMLDSAAIRGEFPMGVSYEKESGKYMSYCFYKGRQKKIGRYDSACKAEVKYLEFKIGVVEEYSLLDEAVVNKKLGFALLSLIAGMRDRIEDIKQEYTYQG
jgi:hypothetical protein